MADLVSNKLLACGRVILEFRVNRYLRMFYSGEELVRKYFFSVVDGNRYESVEAMGSCVVCRYVDYGICETKDVAQLLRLPPLERVSKSRTYGLLYFPRMYGILKSIPEIYYLELADYLFEKPLAPRNLKKKCIEPNSSIEIGRDAGRTLLWERLQFEEIKKFSLEHPQVWAKLKTYPYLYEMYSSENVKAALDLCYLVDGLVKKLNEYLFPPATVSANKSCLKRKSYILNYDESMVEQAKKNAMKRVTKEDLRRRQEYVTNKVKQSNESVSYTHLTLPTICSV
eukprot:TRINITY_DN11551_c0_g1_i1.p1 TRINITY_DN11551_c0_g1~~TRINITY_DN11551_c0_g1_i1.p1  ORF type:complete len:284 (+),score=47.69 TRINITY_DN11551_c0_g1_i1:694-1545(+)